MTNSNGIATLNKAKALRALGLIKHAKKFLPSGDLQKMYRGIVEPHFSYCCSVWGCCSETKLNSLQKIQNRAARITTNVLPSKSYYSDSQRSLDSEQSYERELNIHTRILRIVKEKVQETRKRCCFVKCKEH